MFEFQSKYYKNFSLNTKNSLDKKLKYYDNLYGYVDNKINNVNNIEDFVKTNQDLVKNKEFKTR